MGMVMSPLYGCPLRCLCALPILPYSVLFLFCVLGHIWSPLFVTARESHGSLQLQGACEYSYDHRWRLGDCWLSQRTYATYPESSKQPNPDSTACLPLLFTGHY